MTSTRLASSGFSENKGLKHGLGYYCPVINSVLRGREDTRVWYRETMFSQMVSYDIPLHGPLHEYFFYLGEPCEPEESYLGCSKQFDHRSHSIIFFLFEFKSVDDVGAGKLREMLTLHTNPPAVHRMFTLKAQLLMNVR